MWLSLGATRALSAIQPRRKLELNFKIYDLSKKKKSESEELSPLPKGLALKAPHLEFLPELDNENHRSTLLRQ